LEARPAGRRITRPAAQPFPTSPQVEPLLRDETQSAAFDAQPIKVDPGDPSILADPHALTDLKGRSSKVPPLGGWDSRDNKSVAGRANLEGFCS
jgi:hypothetical protein